MGAYPILESDKPIVFFDTKCLLCNKLVKLLFKFDKNQLFVIAGISSELGLFIQSKFIITEDTMVLFYRGKYYTKSRAFLAICNLLRFPYFFMSIFYLLPTFLRDSFYDFIARNRKSWFSSTNKCSLIPESSQRIIH